MAATWEEKLTYFAVDTGTTNTTVWLMKDDKILRESNHPVGVRQTSIRGNRELLESTLRGTFRSLSRRAPSPPRFVLAAGMLTSQLGLLELPHVLAPAGVGKLAENVRMKSFARVSPLPFFLVLKNGMKIFSITSGDMPMPLSATFITGRPSLAAFADKVIRG